MKTRATLKALKMGGCLVRGAICFFLLAGVSLPATAQTVALLTPERSGTSISFAEKLAAELGRNLKVLDSSLAEAAYLSSVPSAPFNMTTVESRRIGTAIGCDF